MQQENSDWPVTKDARKQKIIEVVEAGLPAFAGAVKNKDGDVVLFDQDAFAADYQEKELYLLGMAVKYAGMHGRELMIVPNK